MRRCITSAITLVAAFAGAACEDGPSQTYSTAPPNAGNLWNNGDTPAAVNGVDASLGASFTGTSKTEICSGAELQSQWARMVAQPLAPPYFVGGANLAGWTVTASGPQVNWSTTTIEDLEYGIDNKLFPAPGATNPPTRLCQGTNLGQGGNSSDVAGGTIDSAFGQNQELLVEWALNTHKIYFVEVNPGYVGPITWQYQEPAPYGAADDPCRLYGGCDGKLHTYTTALNLPITDTPAGEKGTTMLFNWASASAPEIQQQVDTLYRGLTQTYAPDQFDGMSTTNPKGLPPDVGCESSGRCGVRTAADNNGVNPWMAFRTISTYFEFNNPALGQAASSTLATIYFFNIKYAPYSAATSLLDMSTQTGPTAFMNPIGDKGLVCNMSLGKTFGDLSDNCINVFQNQATDTTAMAKVLGDLTHDDQNFTFAIVGINQNYRPPELDIGGPRQFDVIHDNEQPTSTAVAVDFTLDVRAFGPIENDRYPTATAGVWGRDDHGTGAVWHEFGRMVQNDLASRYAKLHGTTPRSLHDPECLFPAELAWGPPATPDGGVADAGKTDAGDSGVTYFSGPTQWHAAPGCTGFEAFITEAYPNVKSSDGTAVDPNDPTAIDPTNVWDVSEAVFGDLPSGGGMRPGGPYGVFCMDPGTYMFCGAPSLFGQVGTLTDVSLAQIIQILGNGDPANLPSGVGDRRYFFEYFMKAFAKYFTSGAATHTGQCGAVGAPVGDAGPIIPGYCDNPAATNKFDPVPYFGDFQINTDDLFMDSFGANYNGGEFVTYQFADGTHDPMGFNLRCLLLGFNTREEHFYMRLDREERALYMAMEAADAKEANQPAWALTKDNHGNLVKDEWGWPRKNADVFLTNMAGSPTIQNAAALTGTGWVGVPNPADAGTPSGAPAGGYNYMPIGATNQFVDPCFPQVPLDQVGKTPWYCATHIDADCVAAYGLQAPTNPDGTLVTRDNGEPLLAGYCGIWNPTAFAVGSQNIQIISTNLPALNGQFEQEAEVAVPSYANPYDLSTKLTAINVLVPWIPNSGGVGFGVPSVTGGQTTIFVQTGQLDFSGQVIVPVIDYLPVSVPDGGVATYDGGPSPYVQIAAYETGDFLGDVFLCYDAVTAANRAGTGQPGDILAVHMYTPVQDIIGWITSHPQAQANCGLVVRYSPYDNYPSMISSTLNGVTVDMDTGQGYGRVIDATLFNPSLGASPPP